MSREQNWTTQACAGRWRSWAALALGLLGVLQMIGDLTGVRALKGLGAASAASPFPKVFSDVNGLETFASDFRLNYELPGAPGGPAWMLRNWQTEKITPELYQHLAGPYNRRNVYGAALSYAPRLPDPLWQAVFCYGLKRGGPLRRELGVPADATHISVVIATKTRGRHDLWILQPDCAQ